MKILTIVGARPQFIKAATVSRAIRFDNEIKEIIVHTGQHFDNNMSDVFFNQLEIPTPDHYLGIDSLSHGAMTGRMMEKLEIIIKKEQPDWVLVYGDTNSTLAGALAATKLQIPIAHVEAGLRSHNMAMPEEINRVLTDRVSSCLLCPTTTSISNLKKEGFPFSSINNCEQKISLVGDVMFDAVLFYRELAYKQVSLDSFNIEEKNYALCTLHRQENTDDIDILKNVLTALRQISNQNMKVVMPIHPRTRSILEKYNMTSLLDGLIIIDPIPYLEMQRLQMGSKFIFTDSGGIQKEAYFHKIPCITLRNETEWVETVEAGWNQLVGTDAERILNTFENFKIPNDQQEKLYGDGNAAEIILNNLKKY